jgi:predicted nucleic acid-binding protein
VFDASVLVRAGIERSTTARQWTARLNDDLRAYAPELIWIELANALRLAVRANALSRTLADDVLATTLQLPIDVRPLAPLCRPALSSALALGLSVYDACYVVLADALDAILVTADRRLADAASRAELIA